MTIEPIKFKVSGRIAELLGEQSVSDVIVAVTELVKNAYDADANKVEVKFEKNNENLRLSIIDNGHGMSIRDLKERWMLIGTDIKVFEKISKTGRRKVGEKGIGRFAVQRLGDKLELISISKENHEKFSLKIDWSKYREPGATFDQIENSLSISQSNVSEHSGITLVMNNLRDLWTKSNIQHLSEQLKLIVPPSWDEKNFSVIVHAPHVGIEYEKLDSALLDFSAYELHCNYDGESKLAYKILLGKKLHDKNILDDESHDLGKLSCGPVKFTLYYFPLGASGPDKKLQPYVLKEPILRTQLKKNHGIKIFRDGFMVKPYGEQGNDWLGLNQMIVARRDVSFSNNTVIGITEITRDKNEQLIDTTTREGLIKNDAFYDLQTLLKHCMRILIKRRSRDYEEHIPELYDNPALKKMEHVIQKISNAASTDKEKKTVEKLKKEFQDTAKQIQDEVIDKINMYRGLASLGISVAAIAHEIGESIGGILQRTRYSLEVLKERPLSFNEIQEVSQNTWDDILKIREFISFAAVFTSAEERTKSAVNVNNIITIVSDAYHSILRDNFITVETVAEKNLHLIWGYKVDFEALLINLMTNAIESLRIMEGGRKIKITCHNDKNDVVIIFSDSGEGIPKINRSIVFEPFWTSKKEGTGLGLAIINEIVKGYEGDISVANSELDHGATFYIRIPKGEET